MKNKFTPVLFSLKPLMLLLFISFFFSCYRKPEACIEANKSIVKLGEPATFNDCSKRSYSYDIDYGDGITILDPSSLQHEYEKPGVYSVIFTAHNKKDNKSAEATVAITVQEPDKSEIIGTWNHYKVEEYQAGYGYSNGDYDPVLTDAFSANSTYIFTSDTVFIDGYPYSWSLGSGGEITIGFNIYLVAKIYNNEFIYKNVSDIYFNKYFLKK